MSPEPHRMQKELLAHLAGDNATVQAARQPAERAPAAVANDPVARPVQKGASGTAALLIVGSATLLAASAAVLAFQLPSGFAVAGAGLAAIAFGKALLAGRRAERDAASREKKYPFRRRAKASLNKAEQDLDRHWQGRETPGGISGDGIRSGDVP